MLFIVGGLQSLSRTDTLILANMSSNGSSTSDTDSMSSDSGINSSHSSSSSMSGGMSDFMDLDEFFLMSKAACISRRKPCHAVTVPNDSAESVTPQEGGSPSQVKQENAFMNSHAESDEDTNSSVSEVADKSERAPGNGGGRRRKYVYNPMPIEKKAKRKFIPTKDKDPEYWNRRMKNNVAAKRSRDMRRQKEIEVNQRYQELEEENSRLKAEIQILQANALLLEKKIAEQTG